MVVVVTVVVVEVTKDETWSSNMFIQTVMFTHSSSPLGAPMFSNMCLLQVQDFLLICYRHHYFEYYGFSRLCLYRGVTGVSRITAMATRAIPFVTFIKYTYICCFVYYICNFALL